MLFLATFKGWSLCLLSPTRPGEDVREESKPSSPVTNQVHASKPRFKAKRVKSIRSAVNHLRQIITLVLFLTTYAVFRVVWGYCVCARARVVSVFMLWSLDVNFLRCPSPVDVSESG